MPSEWGTDVAIVDYLIAQSGCPPRSGLAYDYVVTRGGLFVVGENDLLDVRVPIAPCLVRGLAALDPLLRLKHGLLSRRLWEDIVAAARFWAAKGQEVLLVVTWDGTNYQLIAPVQLVAPTRVFYQPLSNAVLEIHSHHCYPARFSPTDDADEQHLCLYGVVGRLDWEQPEVALRVGAYGYFMPVSWEDVFTGDRGAFRDVQIDLIQDRGDTGDLCD